MKFQKSQITILVLNQSPISVVFPIVRFAGDPKTALIFFGPTFSILGFCISSNFLGYLKTVFYSCLGISCLLIFEWMWNALIFFWSDIFLCWDSVVFQIFGGI